MEGTLGSAPHTGPPPGVPVWKGHWSLFRTLGPAPHGAPVVIPAEEFLLFFRSQKPIAEAVTELLTAEEKEDCLRQPGGSSLLAPHLMNMP